MTMNYTVTKAQLAQIAYADVEGDDVRTDYRGRGMSHDCVGFVTHNPMAVVAAMFEARREMKADGQTGNFVDVDMNDLMQTAMTDSMGLSTIVYFPELTVIENEESK